MALYSEKGQVQQRVLVIHKKRLQRKMLLKHCLEERQFWLR